MGKKSGMDFNSVWERKKKQKKKQRDKVGVRLKLSYADVHVKHVIAYLQALFKEIQFSTLEGLYTFCNKQKGKLMFLEQYLGFFFI